LRAWPNPARDRATIRLEISRPGRVQVALYDVAGRVVSRVADAWSTAGSHAIALDLSPGGTRLGAGVYFVRAEGPDGVRTARLAIVD